MSVLIIGADGMIGHALWRYFTLKTKRAVAGSVRSKRDIAAFGDKAGQIFITGNLEDDTALRLLFENVEPATVINCAGATMHAASGNDPVEALKANSLLPHRLHKLCSEFGAKFIHLSTDCVFDGLSGDKSEEDPPNAVTFYGVSKALGEVRDAADAVTIRTSPVGFELSSARGLLAWFLAQSGEIKGFINAYFSGLTNLELATIIDREFIDGDLFGLYHVTGPRISKFDLITLCKAVFDSPVEIAPNGDLVLDRSLASERFRVQTGYKIKAWADMLEELRDFGALYPPTTITKPQGAL